MRVTPPPPLLVAPEHGVSWSTTSVAPALVDQYFSHEIYHRGFVSRVGSICQWLRVLFTLLPRLIDHFRPSVQPPGPPTLPAPVRGSGAGGGWGQQGRPPIRVGPRLSQLVFLDVRRVSSHGRKTDPGVLLLFWGDFGGRAPTAVGDQSYLGQFTVSI